jgi:predicted DNA-binding transcriptional regulator AlpA
MLNNSLEIKDNSGIARYGDQKLLFEKLIWTKEDVSSFTRLSIGTIYNKTSKGEIPYKKRGNRLYFIPQDILNWIDEGGL